MLAFVGDVAACRDAIELDERLATLPRVVGADSIVVTACRDWASDVEVEVGDPDVYRSDLITVIGRDWREHPLLCGDLGQASFGARRTSDFVRTHEWRRKGLFNDFYRPLGMTRELTAQVSWGPVGSSCCVVLHRAGRDFSERELAMLTGIAPHLRAARARLEAEALMSERLALIEHGLEASRRGVLVLGADGRLLAAGATARALLARWFGRRDGDAVALPDALADWWQAAHTGRAAPGTEPAAGPTGARPASAPDLLLERDGRRMRARLVYARGESLVLLTERDDTAADAAARLARLLPITRREADVLARLAIGSTNDGIAHDLGISRHTVVRHVESVYAKLDVHTRAAATRAALDALADDDG